MLKLFHCPGVCSLASLIALEEAGAPFETIIVNLKAGEQHAPEYRAINPKGRVPALATDRGILTENPAIMTYIAMTFPQAQLAPLDDPYELARMQSFNAFIASSLQPAAGPIGQPQRYSDDPAVQAVLKPKALENIASYFDLIEAELLIGPWVLGDRFSVSDGYLFTFSEVISLLNLDETRYPRILDHRKRMLERPAVKKALG